MGNQAVTGGGGGRLVGQPIACCPRRGHAAPWAGEGGTQLGGGSRRGGCCCRVVGCGEGAGTVDRARRSGAHSELPCRQPARRLCSAGSSAGRAGRRPIRPPPSSAQRSPHLPYSCCSSGLLGTAFAKSCILHLGLCLRTDSLRGWLCLGGGAGRGSAGGGGGGVGAVLLENHLTARTTLIPFSTPRCARHPQAQDNARRRCWRRAAAPPPPNAAPPRRPLKGRGRLQHGTCRRLHHRRCQLQHLEVQHGTQAQVWARAPRSQRPETRLHCIKGKTVCRQALVAALEARGRSYNANARGGLSRHEAPPTWRDARAGAYILDAPRRELNEEG